MSFSLSFPLNYISHRLLLSQRTSSRSPSVRSSSGRQLAFTPCDPHARSAMLSLPRLYTRQSPQFLCLLALNLGFLIYTRMSPTSHLDPSALVQSLPVHIPDHLPSLYAHQQSHLHTRNHTGDFTSRASSKKKRVARAFSSGTPLILSPSRHVPTGAHTLSHPTATCEVCVATPDDPLCEYGLDNVRLSRSYEGSGHRVRKFLEKALRGEKVRIG